MKAIIKLNEVTVSNHGVNKAILNVSLKAENDQEDNVEFDVSSTGMSVRLISDVAIYDLHQISEWLQKDSNGTKLRKLAKKYIWMTIELEGEITL